MSDFNQRQTKNVERRTAQTEVKEVPFTDISVRVYNDANQSISNNTTTVLTFNQERWDTDGMHSTSANTSRLTCTRAGKHLIIGQVYWASSSLGMREIGIRLNGATFLAVKDNTPNASFAHGMVIPTEYILAVGDYVELTAYQNSGGALNALVSGNFASEFMMHRLV